MLLENLWRRNKNSNAQSFDPTQLHNRPLQQMLEHLGRQCQERQRTWSRTTFRVSAWSTASPLKYKASSLRSFTRMQPYGPEPLSLYHQHWWSLPSMPQVTQCHIMRTCPSGGRMTTYRQHASSVVRDKLLATSWTTAKWHWICAGTTDMKSYGPSPALSRNKYQMMWQSWQNYPMVTNTSSHQAWLLQTYALTW